MVSCMQTGENSLTQVAGNGFALSATDSSLGRMFVCGGTGPSLKYLDSAEVLDDQSGETALNCQTLTHFKRKNKKKVADLHCTHRKMGASSSAS